MEKWVKLVSIWSVFWEKVSIFGNGQTHIFDMHISWWFDDPNIWFRLFWLNHFYDSLHVTQRSISRFHTVWKVRDFFIYTILHIIPIISVYINSYSWWSNQKVIYSSLPSRSFNHDWRIFGGSQNRMKNYLWLICLATSLSDLLNIYVLRSSLHLAYLFS